MDLQKAHEMQLHTLDMQQLQQLQERVTADIERFAQSLQFFARSSGIYHSAGKAISGLTESKEGEGGGHLKTHKRMHTCAFCSASTSSTNVE